MSISSTDFERLLREALNQAKAAAPLASDDLVHCASKAAEAVAQVTGGAAALELVILNQTGDTTTYQLQLRKVGSEAPPSDLGIYRLSPTGYPVQRWYSRRKWEAQPDQPDQMLQDLGALEGHFRWMISKPESRLVVLVAFFQQQAVSSGAGTRLADMIVASEYPTAFLRAGSPVISPL